MQTFRESSLATERKQARETNMTVKLTWLPAGPPASASPAPQHPRSFTCSSVRVQCSRNKMKFAWVAGVRTLFERNI